MARLETLVPPPVWAAIVGACMFGASRVGTAWSIGSWGRAAAVVLALIGIGVALAGIASFARAGTTVDPHDPTKASALVDSGIYRVTRNPMYVGLTLVVGAWGFLLGDPVLALVGAGVFVVVITRLQIVPEERILRERFGAAYDDLCSSTRRWI